MKQLRIFILVLGLVYIVSALGFAPWKRGGEERSGVLNWDVYGYSFYLSGVLHGDLWEVKFLDGIDSTYRPCNEVMGYGRFGVEGTERKAFKYTVGNAYFYAPFYFGAHWVNKWFLGYEADGYSMPYSVGLTVGWIFWSLWGLYVLGVLLLRYFSVWSVLATLLSIGLGTNYYAYSVQIIGMNHIPLFFCGAVGLLAADRWAMEGRGRDLAILAGALGLSVVLRPTELVLVLALPMVLVRVWQVNGQWLNFVLGRWRQVLVAGLVGLAMVLPQVLYWWGATGKLVHYSYQGEYFDFGNPHLWKGLFSYRKGLFVYAPIMWLGVLGLPIFLWRNWRLGSFWLLYMGVNVYVILSWSAWAYGGSFGARSMIQSFVFWALPMAYFFEYIVLNIRSLRARFLAWGLGLKVGLVTAALVGLQIVQTLQYHWSIIHWENMSKEAYWFTFCKFHYTHEELGHLWMLYNRPIVED